MDFKMGCYPHATSNQSTRLVAPIIFFQFFFEERHLFLGSQLASGCLIVTRILLRWIPPAIPFSLDCFCGAHFNFLQSLSREWMKGFERAKHRVLFVLRTHPEQRHVWIQRKRVVQTFFDVHSRKLGLCRQFFAARTEFSARTFLQRLIVTCRVAEQFSCTKSFEANRTDAFL